MADTLHTLSILFYILVILFLVLSIVIWFTFKIPDVIGDLSGHNAKKSIAQMRQSNERNIGKSSINNIEGTILLNENIAIKHDNQATELLLDNETDLLEENSETADLEDAVSIAYRKPSTVIIQKIEEVMLIHTEEVI